MPSEIIYGRNAVLEALRARGTVNRVYLVREGKVASRDEIIEAARTADAPFEFVPLAKLNSMTGVSDHQGCAATVSPVSYATLDSVLASLGPRAILLALDGVQHPRNVGMLLRTAAGAGAAAVLLPQRGGALLDPDIVRASAGAVMHVPVIACANLAQTLRQLKDHDFWVYGLDATARDSVFTNRWPNRTVLVAGGETKGMRPGTAKLCDTLLSIPLHNGLDSLNVAVSAGIALYQAQYGNKS